LALLVTMPMVGAMYGVPPMLEIKWASSEALLLPVTAIVNPLSDIVPIDN